MQQFCHIFKKFFDFFTARPIKEGRTMTWNHTVKMIQDYKYSFTAAERNTF